MPFLSPLDTRVYHPGEFALLRRFGFQFDLEGRRYRLWAPAGFISDFASIPWLVQRLPGFDVNGPSRPAAIPHDLLYCHHGRLPVEEIDPASGGVTALVDAQFSRAQCDEIFRLALLDVGGDDFTRLMIDQRYSRAQVALFWSGVRVGGWYRWHQRRSGVVPEEDFVPFDFLKKHRDRPQEIEAC